MTSGNQGVTDGRAWAGLLVLVLAWGSSFLITSIALAGMAPFFIVGARIALAAVVIGVIARGLSGPFPREARFWLWSLPIGGFGLLGSYGAYTWAQLGAPSGVVAIYIAVGPILVALLSQLVSDERVGRRGAAGFGVGFLGVLCVIGPEQALALGSGAVLSEGAALLAAISFAIGAVATRMAPRFDALHASAGALIAAAVLGAPLALAQAPATVPPTAAIAALLALGLIQTSLAQVVRYWLVKRSGALFTAQASYLMPIWAVFLGWLFLGESLSALDAAGLALILTGVALTQRG